MSEFVQVVMALLASFSGESAKYMIKKRYGVKRINLTRPTRHTERDLKEAYHNLKEREGHLPTRRDALHLLMETYRSLQLENILSGKHSFVRPTLEAVFLDEKDLLHGEAGEVLGLRRVRMRERTRYVREDAHVQTDSDFSDRLAAIKTVTTLDGLNELYAIALHGTREGEYAGNHIALVSKRAYVQERPGIIHGRRARTLLGRLLTNEIDYSRAAGWDQVRTVEVAAYERDSTKRLSLGSDFTTEYGKPPSEVKTAEELAKLFDKKEFPQFVQYLHYIQSLLSISSTQSIQVAMNYAKKYGDNLTRQISERFLSSVKPLSREQVLILPSRNPEVYICSLHDLEKFEALTSLITSGH